jgi:hypothetical protein
MEGTQAAGAMRIVRRCGTVGGSDGVCPVVEQSLAICIETAEVADAEQGALVGECGEQAARATSPLDMMRKSDSPGRMSSAFGPPASQS